MNSIWNKNITIFKNRFPSLYPLFQDAICKFSNAIDNNAQETVFPFWTLSQCKNGQITVQENGLRLHSAYNPQKEAESLCNSIKQEMQQKDAIAFMGFGLGYGPIQACTDFADKTIILIEPDIDHFLASMILLDFKIFFSHPSIVLAIGCIPEDAIGILNNFGLHQTKLIENQSFQNHAKEYFSLLQTLIHRNLQKEDINNATLEKFRKLWFRNSFSNLSKTCLLDPVNIYKGKGADLPFLILGAGPSLQMILPHLNQIRNKVVTVCVDTSLRACLRYGYQPDFIIITDPQYWAYRHIAGLESPESILIIENAVYPSVFNFHCKKIVACQSQIPIGNFFEQRVLELGSLGAGGSVASCAWNFAELAGSSKIYVCGLDLGFPDKQTHIKGSTFEQASHTNSTRTRPAETSGMPMLFSGNACFEMDYLGNRILTDQRMKMFAWWFESRIASCPHTKTFTISPQGLKIPGITVVPVQELLNLPDLAPQKNNFLSQTLIPFAKDNRTFLSKHTFNDSCTTSLEITSSEIQDRKNRFLNAKKAFNQELSKAYNICTKALSILNSVDTPVIHENKTEVNHKNKSHIENQNLMGSKTLEEKEKLLRQLKDQLSSLSIAKILELVPPSNLSGTSKLESYKISFSSIQNFCNQSIIQ